MLKTLIVSILMTGFIWLVASVPLYLGKTMRKGELSRSEKKRIFEKVEKLTSNRFNRNKFM
jgi:hypothetical protein